MTTSTPAYETNGATWWSRRPAAWPVFILVLGITISAISARWLAERIEREASAEFERAVDHVGFSLRERFALPIQALRGLKGLYAASREVTPQEFKAYIEGRELKVEAAGVRAYAFVQPVAPADLPRFVAAERERHPFYERQALGPQTEDLHYLVRFIEPLSANLHALGLDLGTEVARNAGLQRAIVTGLPALSGALQLVQDDQSRVALLFFMPVYRQGADPVSDRQRRAALSGVLTSPVVLSELLAPVARSLSASVGFELFSGGDGQPQTLLYQSAADLADSVVGRRQESAPLHVAGSSFTLRVHSTPLHDASVDRQSPWWLLGGGSLLSAALAWMAWLTAVGRRRAEALVAHVTQDLDRLAMVARHTSDSVLLLGNDGLVTWVNQGFERLSGFAAKDAVGRHPGRLLNSRALEPGALEPLRRIMAGGEGAFKGEVLNTRKDGSDYWVELELRTVQDRLGKPCGYIAVESDITERKRADAALATALRDNQALLGTIRTHAIVSVSDGQGHIQDVNDAFCTLSGYTREELLGQDHRLVNSGTHPASFWGAMWDDISAGRPWRGRVCNRAKDGSLYWVDSIIAPFLGADGRIEKFVSVRHDVTASVLAAEELARGRERLAQILDATAAGTWEVDLLTGEDLINDRYAGMLGDDIASLTRRMDGNFLSLVHPDDRPQVELARHAHLDGISAVYEVEFRMRHAQGHWTWIFSRGRALRRASDGLPLRMSGLHLDIQQRKTSEQALHASQALLQTTGQMAGVGGWQIELASRTLTWSDQTCRIFDLPPGHRPTVREFMGYFPADAQARIRDIVDEAIAAGSPCDLELPVRTALGRERWVRAMGRVEAEAGRPVRLVGAMQDITERRAMEAELRRANQVMSSILEHLPCGLSVFDGELRLVVANRKYRETLAFPDALFDPDRPHFESFIRYNAARGDYGPGDLETQVQEIVARATAPATPHRFERTRPDGRVIEIQGGPMPGGGFVTTYTDISDRRQAQLQVQRSEALLRGAIDAIDEAFVLYDPDDRLVFCNDRFRALYPASRDLIVPGVRFEDMVRAAVEMGDAQAPNGDAEALIADRIARHRACNPTPVQPLADGRVMRFLESRMADGHTVGFRIDITDLVRASEAAEAASRAKSQFLANMSHEIRTPMNAILGMLRLLRRTPLTARQQDYAGKTEGAARNLLALLNDILDFSKAEAGKVELDPQPFRPDQLLRDLSVILSANAHGKPVELLYDIDPALPEWLLGDGLRLQQVLINLGGNAIKFTERGEVVIKLALCSRSDEQLGLAVSVRDTGIGIAPENHARIFSGFTQAEASTTRRFGGTGLGVAICQRLVALMGGELRLDSALGQGSCFSFELQLPLVTDEAAAGADPAWAEAQSPQPAPGGSAPHVLIVDDHPLARELLAAMTNSLGWSCELAAGGEQALALLAAKPDAYDAVFIDWQMPGLDGWQTCQRMRVSSERTPLLVMVTAQGREAMEQRSSEDQALLDGFLVKPVTAAMLAEALGRARVPADAVPPAAEAQTAGRGRLAGLRLLVVEDNLNNQQVARELLEDEGASVQLADNGRLAVQAVATATTPFDAVLMDLQMPEMDGLTAASLIRQDLKQTNLPIVAMTANAMASDREACLAAGMNDHVGKPFDLDPLVDLLRRLTRRAGLAPAPSGVPSGLSAAQREAAQGAGVELDAALARMGGQLPTYQRLLRNFVHDMVAWPAMLAGQAQAGDHEALKRELHTLKGLASTLGASALAGTAAAAESEAATEAVGGPALLALQDHLQQALAPLGALCDLLAPAPAASAAPPSAVLRQALSTLAELLADADMEATVEMARLRDQAGAAMAEKLLPLDEAVARLDFEQALLCCRALMAHTEP